jgi:hypothetical protein
MPEQGRDQPGLGIQASFGRLRFAQAARHFLMGAACLLPLPRQLSAIASNTITLPTNDSAVKKNFRLADERGRSDLFGWQQQKLLRRSIAIFVFAPVARHMMQLVPSAEVA